MADDAAVQIKYLSKEIDNLDKKIQGAIDLVKTYDKDIAHFFELAREKGIANTDQLVDYLSKRLSNLQIKTAATPFLGLFDEKEIDKAAKRYAALLEKQDAVEKARSIAVGGRKFGELQGEDLKNWREFSSLLATINEQKKQIERSNPDAVDAGKKLYSEQLAFQKAQDVQSQERKRIAQEEAEVKRKAAEDERELNRLIAEEERKKIEAAKQRYKEAIDANKSMIKEEEELAKLRREQRTAESKAAYNEYFKKQQNAQKQADKESLNNQRRQIQLKAEMAAIDKRRAVEGKQLSAEEKTRYRDISAELTKLIAKQKELDAISQGSGKRARGKLSKFEISEAEKAMRRYGNAVQDARNKQQGLNNETNKMLPTLQRLASTLGVAFSIRGLAQFGKKLIEVRSEFELQQVALRSILQNKQLADEIWDKTLRASLQSPYTAMQLTKYTKQLAAYRIETAKLFDTTKRLADVSAGLGVDMQRLILAYGQVKAANYLRASEIRQFTEAGVNILGELSQYFTEAKGEMVSTAQVMDMVQKRMVKFEDVAEIFKRMTDQGGIFYNMQYIQSQTVRGQMMKLKDAFDQMLNSIGQGNEGTIKNLISLLNDMVRNWRSIAIALKSIGWGIAINWVGKYALALTGLTKVTKTTAAGIVKLKTVLSSLSSFITLPTILISIATALLSMQQRMRAVNKEIDEQNYKLYESQKYFEELRYKIHLNNSSINDETSSEEENTQAKEANRAIMQKLINEYPQLAEQMEINEQGLITMNGMLDANIRKLKEQRTLVNAMKTQSMFSDTDQKNLSDWEMKLSSIRVKMSSVQSEAERLVSAMDENNLQSTQLYNVYKQIAELDIANDALCAARAFEDISRTIEHMSFEQFDKLNEELGDFDEYKLPSWLGGFLERKMGLGHPILPWSGSFEMYDMWGDENRAISALDNIQSELMRYYRNGIQDNEEYLEEVGDMTTEEFLKWLVQNAGRLNKDTAEGINKANEIFIKTLAPQSDDMKSYLNKYFNNLLGIDEMAFVRAEARLGWLRKKVEEHEALPQLGMLENPDRIAAYKAILKEIDQLESFLKNRGIDFFAIAENIGGTTKPDFELNAANLRKQVNLLEEMKKRYDELSKSAYGYAKSEAKVREAFKDSFDEIFKGSGIDMKDIDFTSMEGLSASIQKVLDAATNIKEEVKQEIMKKIDSYEARIKIDAQVRVREDFAREIEKMFSDYELTLELQKLNISPDAAKNLFPNLDLKTMKDIQDRMQAFYQDQVDAGGFDEKDLETYRKYADKIDAEIMKERMARAKEYSKFIEKEYSDRAKLQMQYARDVAFVRMNFEGEQQENILRDLKNKLDKDLNQLEWKSFRESSFYVDMMDDLTSLPKEYLDMMLKKLDEIIQNSQIDPEVMKEAIKARQKVIDAQLDIRPLKVMKDSLDGIKKAMKDMDVGGTFRQTYKNIQKEIKDKEELIQKNEKEAQTYREIAVALKLVEDANDAVTEAKGKLGDEALASFTQEDNNLQDEFIKNAKRIAEIKAKEDKATIAEKDELATLQARNKYLEQQIYFLNQAQEALKKYNDTLQEQQVSGFTTMGFSSSKDAESAAQGKEEENKQNETRLAKLREWLKQFKTFFEGWTKFNAAINNTINSVAQAGNAFYDMFQALGGETDAVTDAWKEFGNTMVSTITNTLTIIPMMVAAFKAAGIAITSALGIISIAAQALTVIFTTITGFAKLHDAGYEKTIQRLQNKIDDLANAYKRLEKAIDKTLTSSDYLSDYNQQVQNIHDRIDAINAQINAERSKKNSSAEKIRQYQNEIIELEEELENIEQKKIEVFGGLGEVNYRSAAEEFVDAWKEAFLETGDGLQGLQDHFDEFLNEWFVKQATMRIAGRMLEPLFEDIDKAVDESSQGGANVLLSELQRVREKFATIAPQLSDALEQLAGMWGLGDTEGGLSGLAAGIQGMTEEQANILEAYWNSVRMYTASIDMNVSRIADMLGAGSRDITNPQLQQLELIAHNTASIQRMFESVVMSGHTKGQSGIRVFVD